MYVVITPINIIVWGIMKQRHYARDLEDLFVYLNHSYCMATTAVEEMQFNIQAVVTAARVNLINTLRAQFQQHLDELEYYENSMPQLVADSQFPEDIRQSVGDKCMELCKALRILSFQVLDGIKHTESAMVYLGEQQNIQGASIQ